MRLWLTLILAVSLPLIAGAADTDQFQDLTRVPDTISVETEAGSAGLPAGPNGVWSGGGVTVTTRARHGGLEVELAAPGVAVKHLQLHWNAAMPSDWQYLGDAWERSYGDLEWKPLNAKRVMPWYFLASNGTLTHGYGVKTGPAAFCHWTADAAGITLHADVRCGGSGVQLGGRTLPVCSVVCRRGRAGETPFAVARAFCGLMCDRPVLPKQPVYGFNDWYCAYGHDTVDEFLKDAGYMVGLSPKNGVRPFAVVDDGWESAAEHTTQSNLWLRINPQFSANLDMPEFAKRIRALGARPGLWFRPLIASPDAPASWRLSRDSKYLDPTVPEVRAYLAETIRRFHRWGFELIKHDFSTFDLTGLWGMQMGGEVTPDGWAFADRSRTSAEVIRGLYLDIRQAAGKQMLITGCNTIGHLAAGIFEMQRIGDDTSGKQWARTRKMGVNCLAFRAPQDGTFFAVDPDCAGQTTADSVPWDKNRQWLNLLGRSGTVLFTSFPRDILSPDREQDLRAALNAASARQPLAEPLDWMAGRTPEHWKLDGQVVDFNW